MKKLFYTLLAFTIIFSTCKNKGEENESIGQCVLGNCKNGVGIFYFPESTKWIGDEFGEKPYIIEASKYIGEWKEKRRNGIGTSIFYDETGEISDIYSGEWKNDMKHGEGTYTYSDGSVLKGLWKNNKFLGE